MDNVYKNVRIKKSEKGNCSICGEFKKFSCDHIPPKSCGNNGKMHYDLYINIVYENQKDSKSRHIITQNGIKFFHICESCNNLWGTKYDAELKHFRDNVLSLLSENSTNLTINLTSIIKAVLGHFLASVPYSETPIDNDLRNYLSSNNKDILSKYSLFCLCYPYENHIFIMRNYVVKNFSKKELKLPEGVISSMYFYPFAFILAKKQDLNRGIDLIDMLNSNKEYDFSCNDWMFNNRILSKNWPCDISTIDEIGTDAVFLGNDFSYSVKTVSVE